MLSQESADYGTSMEKLCEVPSFVAYRILKGYLKKKFQYPAAIDGWDKNEQKIIDTFEAGFDQSGKKRKDEEVVEYLSLMKLLFTKLEKKINKNI